MKGSLDTEKYRNMADAVRMDDKQSFCDERGEKKTCKLFYHL